MQIVLGVPYLMLWVIMFGCLLSIWPYLVSFLVSWLPSSLALMPLLRLLTLLPIALLSHQHGVSMMCSTLVSLNLLWVSRLGLLLIPLSALVLTPLASMRSRIFLTIVRRILECNIWLSGVGILLLRRPGSLSCTCPIVVLFCWLIRDVGGYVHPSGGSDVRFCFSWFYTQSAEPRTSISHVVGDPLRGSPPTRLSKGRGST